MHFAVLLLLISVTARADQVSLPHTLANNTVANAENVQANFDTLVVQSNENDSRIGNLEGITVVIGEPNANLSVGGGLQLLTMGSPEPYSGALNTAVGIDALDGTSSGYYNTAIGHRAAAGNTTGYYNTAVGYIALGNNSTGAGNTAVGILALYGASLSTDSGSSQNSALGDHALYSNSGFGNTAVGAQSLRENTTGSANTATGSFALYSNTEGRDNTALGYYALHGNIEGSYNTAIGVSADVSAGYLTNATAIGYGAGVNASNKVQLGNGDVTSVATAGKLTTGAVTYPNVDGQAGEVLTTDGNGVAGWGADSDTLASLTCSADQIPAWDGQNAQWVCATNFSSRATELEEQVASLQEQLQSRQQELLAIVQSQQEQIAQLQTMVEHQFAMN